VDELTGELDRLDAAMDRFEQMSNKLTQPMNASNANINVNAGGVGTWLCCTACLIMLSMNMFLGYLYIDQSRKIDRLQDCINVVLQWAPQLKELVNQTVKENKH
jgi:hypothetical protein